MYMFTYNKGPKEKSLTVPGTLTLPVGVASDDYSMQLGISRNATQKHISIIGEEQDSALQYILDNLYNVYPSYAVIKSCITSRKDVMFSNYDALSICNSIESLHLSIKAHCGMSKSYSGFIKCPEVVVLQDLFELQDNSAGTVHDAINTLFEECKDENTYCVITSKHDSLKLLQLTPFIGTELKADYVSGDGNVIVSCQHKGRVDELTVPHYVR